MTDQEINEAIAFHIGWTKETKEIERQDGYQWTEVVTHWRTPGGTRISCCEDYCNDLNAMHEAEKFLKTHNEWSDYRRWLANHISATARNRAEAFIRTIGKWRDA